ncbi:hypothetical protein GCM10023144_46730 [Pigmentiphaga soli]|uniref:Uncharacterized protein n=1 Tax=Pigmentiphaga soli TaxID=1007095 RepID=A0ABP8HSA0_9BURK
MLALRLGLVQGEVGVGQQLADLQPLRGGHQHGVAGRVTEAAVDVLEAVQVHHHDAALGGRQRGLDPVAEQGAVGQAGQRVLRPADSAGSARAGAAGASVRYRRARGHAAGSWRRRCRILFLIGIDAGSEGIFRAWNR